MARANKILSNIVGLAAAREVCQGYLANEIDTRTNESVGGNPPSPFDARWKRYEPNTYADTGATITTTAPNPITDTRQRKKGVVTDLEASIGFNHDLSPTNMQDLFEASFFADIVKLKDATGTGTITAGAATPANGSIVYDGKVVGYRGAEGQFSITITGGKECLNVTLQTPSFSFITSGIKAGDWIFIGGDTDNRKFTSTGSGSGEINTERNNGFKRVSEVSAAKLVFDKTNSGSLLDLGAGKTIEIYFGETLNNAVTSADFRNNNTLQFERTLGQSDLNNDATKQSELITGCVLNEMSINLPASGLVNVDVGFIAKDQFLLPDLNNKQPAHQVSPKTKPSGEPISDLIDNEDIFNTTSDISRMRMSLIDSVNTDLFAFITEASITINNGVTPDKALSVLGSFDYSLGNFTVAGSVQAYFANVDAVRAVKDNADVTIDYILVKKNKGIVFDLPLITLGDGRLNVEEGQSISLPLNTEAAKSSFGYTMKIVFFPYLPTLADIM